MKNTLMFLLVMCSGSAIFAEDSNSTAVESDKVTTKLEVENKRLASKVEFLEKKVVEKSRIVAELREQISALNDALVFSEELSIEKSFEIENALIKIKELERTLGSQFNGD